MKQQLLQALSALDGALARQVAYLSCTEQDIRLVMYVQPGSKDHQRLREIITKCCSDFFPKHRLTLAFNELSPKHPQIILVASGKGGVGKSTIAALLAQTLSCAGYRTKLLDLDLYGPSIPTIFGINDTRVSEEVIAHGVGIRSIGLIHEGAVAWRGPLLSKIVQKLFSGFAESGADYLIVDLPPGTGDIHLSVLNNYRSNIAGVLMVTTPSLLAIKDVVRSIDLYRKFSVKIYGVIENMVGEHGTYMAGEYLAEQYGLEIIGKIPLLPAVTKACDQGLCLNGLIQLPINWLTTHRHFTSA